MKKYNKFFQIGNILGLPKKDLKKFLETSNTITDQPYLINGGPDYPGTYYGTISINDF